MAKLYQKKEDGTYKLVSGWHLEKSVSIGQIIIIITTIMGLLWWGAKVDARINVLEVARVETLATSQHDNDVIRQSLARIEQRVDAIYSRDSR